MIHKYYCSRCKATDVPLVKNNKTRNIQYYFCRSCNNARARKYGSTSKGRAAIQRAVKKSVSKYPEKQRAREIVNYAIQVGTLAKPEFCTRCGVPGRIEGHHIDYNKPLEVTWVCTPCHRTYHKRGLVV